VTLPADVARCPGVGYDEGAGIEWRDGCDDCLRRASPPVDPERMMAPPVLVVFECEARIAPERFNAELTGRPEA
jgi:hypothetical protein